MKDKLKAALSSSWNFLESNYKWFEEVTIIVVFYLIGSFFVQIEFPEKRFDIVAFFLSFAYIGYLVYFTSKAISNYGFSRMKKEQSPWKLILIILFISIPAGIYSFIDELLSFWTPWKFTGAATICLMTLITAFSLTDPNTVIIEKVTPTTFITILFVWSLLVWLFKEVVRASIPLEWDKEAMGEMDDDELKEGEK